MKTCLYQPIFINPQAYFVFPSLYHIEKGDSFIEHANITGQLIVNTLTDDPIILTVKDNNQVDFSIFAGKHIRISQYTDEGAVILGEWLMPGESTPVYPDWFTSSVKAIYDPKKQGLTNYDVIEAYTEDFKKWNNCPEKYTGSLTSNSLALTNVSQKTALIYSPIKPYDFKVLIRGLQEGQHVKFGFDYGEQILEADKDGVYTLEWKEGLRSYGIYTNFVGECNITITQLPTSILKDLSGNGNHAYLYDGKMYAVCYGFPILEDYTVMAERTWFEIGNHSCFASKRIGANKGAFAIEYRKLYAENFGSYTPITFVANKKEIIVQSKEKYNDKDLIAGNEIDTNQLLIGGISLNYNRLNEPYIGCHGAIIIADRSFTQEEIDWIKENIYNIEI